MPGEDVLGKNEIFLIFLLKKRSDGRETTLDRDRNRDRDRDRDFVFSSCCCLSTTGIKLCSRCLNHHRVMFKEWKYERLKLILASTVSWRKWSSVSGQEPS